MSALIQCVQCPSVASVIQRPGGSKGVDVWDEEWWGD